MGCAASRVYPTSLIPSPELLSIQASLHAHLSIPPVYYSVRPGPRVGGADSQARVEGLAAFAVLSKNTG